MKVNIDNLQTMNNNEIILFHAYFCSVHNKWDKMDAVYSAINS